MAGRWVAMHARAHLCDTSPGNGDFMIRIKTLDNGVTVLTEPIESVRSCAIGLWLVMGSRDEREHEEGLTHFAEHMLFKGTSRYNAQDLANTINFLGGHVNAYTSQEVMSLQAKAIDTKAAMTLDLLAEMLTDSVFPDAEVGRERQVILEECRMYEDSPEDFSHDLFVQNLWPRDPLGRPVIGRRSAIRRFTRGRLMAFWSEHFRPERLVVSMAGAFDEAACRKVIEQRLGRLERGRRPLGKRAKPPVEATRRSHRARAVEQAQFVIGARGPHRTHPDRFAFGLMNMILGGGMSSRLFQEIRERRGLAYSISSYIQYFSDCGYLAIAGGTSPQTLDEVLRITMDEVARIREEFVTPPELEMARAQVIDAILMGMESTDARMSRLAENWISLGRVPSIEETLGKLEAVAVADVRRVARKYCLPAAMAASIIGPKAVGKSLDKWRRMAGRQA